MNPQYLPQQQYGAPSHGFPNNGQNSQGFQSVPLAPPKSGVPSNVLPTSVSSAPQIGNLLGKMPSGHLSPFTVLPPGQKISDSHNSIDQKQSSNNNMDGAPLKPLIDLETNDNFVNGPPRNVQLQMQNGPLHNGANSGGFSIPPSQLPPSNIQARPIGPPTTQQPHGVSPLSQNRSSPNSQAPSRPPPSFTPSSQPGQIGPPPVSQSVPASLGYQQPTSQISAPPSVDSHSGQMPPATSSGHQLPPNQFAGQMISLDQQMSASSTPQGSQQNLLGPPSQTGQLNNFSATSHAAQQNLLGPPPQNSQQNPLGLQTQGGQRNDYSSLSQGIQQNSFSAVPLTGQSNQPGQPPFSGQPNLPSMGQQLPVGGHSQPAVPGQNMPVRSPMQSAAIPSQGMPPMNLPGSPGVASQNQQGFPGQSPLQGQPPASNQSLYGQPPTRGPLQIQNQPLNSQNPYGQPPASGQVPPPGQSLMSGRPSQQSLFRQPPPSGQQLLPGQQQLPGQPPLPGQPLFPGQPPLPGNPTGPQSPMQQVGGPGQMPPSGPYNQSRIPSNQYSNQLNNQMKNMNIGGPKQYPEVPQKGPMNGEIGPHMPPPINGQQMRSPVGFPPMPGQQLPMPGHQLPMPGQQQPIPGQQQPMPPVPGGYPPQPGYPQQQGLQQQPGYPQHPSYQQQQAQQRRLDPDQMPSPIQVMTGDQANRSGVFVTNQKGLVPPLVTTNFVVQDQGNTSPRFIRSTMYNVPISNDIMKTTAVPFSLVISPMARQMEGEYPPPIVNFGELGPVRCIRCKAYMCPFMNFVDSGRRFQCAFCKATTDVPAEYFQHLDHTGQRMDRYERPELVLGTYEFTATADYCRNNILPKPPAIIFVIDVSYNSVKSGLVSLMCSQMKQIIQNLPLDQGLEKSNMRVGFITYNNSVHFYNIKGTLAAPQMLIVGDTHEMFMPLLDGFLSTPEESEAIIDALMEQIPIMFASTRETETVLLPAILAGVEALKASESAGKLLVFTSNLPSAEAPGKLKNRDDRKLLGTDKERTILTPQNQAYNQLGQDCVQAGCSVDLFVFNNSYIDVATIGQVSRLSGGEVYKYTYFQADIDGDRLIGDIILNISRPIAFDAIMRVRTSTGIRPTDFYGHFFMSNTTDMELASIDCDKAIALEIKHDDKLQEEDGVFIQSALLYTSCSGQRRLRISNLSLKTCSQMADLYRGCDLDTLINYISKQSIFKLMDNNPKAVKDAIVNRAAHILATYRKNCASPSSAGQLILPECMKLLPLYVNCLLKSDALSGGSDMTVDERSFVMQAVMTMDVPTSVHFFYPRLMPIHDIDLGEQVAVPYPIRCSIEKMSEQGVYILENGIHMFLWIGLGVNPDFIQKVFGVQSAAQVNIEQIRLPDLDNPLSVAVRNIIEEIRIQRHRHMRLTLVRQREKLEPVFKHFLVEDRGVDGSPSYVDFLCHMHKEIRNILS